MEQTYDQPLAELNAGKITYQEFLRRANCEEQFKKWCSEHHLAADEGAAQCYFDYYGFKENDVEKEFIEPLQ